MLFFQFIFGLFAVMVLSIIGIVLFLFLKLKRMTNRFSSTAFSQGRAQQSRAEGTKRRSTEYGDGVVMEEELHDERSPRDAGRKIFTKDEGEYVEFEEVD